MRYTRWKWPMVVVVLATLLSGMFAATPSGWAQTAPEKKFKVQVTVNSGGDDSMKNALAKLLADEFAKLTDVELVGEKPAWTMEVLGAAPRNEKQEPLAFFASVLVSQHFSREYWNGVYGTLAEFLLKRQYERSDKSAKPFVVAPKMIADLEPAWTGAASRMTLDAATEQMARKHAYYLKGAMDLRVLAQEIVAGFDKGQLEPSRKQ